MIETHPFGNFVPKKARYLLIGSFPGKIDENYDFYYSNKRNQFWPIMENIYKVDLKTKSQKIKL